MENRETKVNIEKSVWKYARRLHLFTGALLLLVIFLIYNSDTGTRVELYYIVIAIQFIVSSVIKFIEKVLVDVLCKPDN